MNFEVKSFTDLNVYELYDILRLRSEVFVVEQDCVYQDMDNKDQEGFHILGFNENAELIAYTRLLPPGISYSNFASIGRVIVKESARKSGLGKDLMVFSIEASKSYFPSHNIKISGQTYLLKFYKDLGFMPVGEGYLEDGIPHRAMVYEVI